MSAVENPVTWRDAAELTAGNVTIESERKKDGTVRFTAWLGGKVLGEMTVSVMPLVHDMQIQQGTLQRKIADALFQYASGYVKASGFGEAAVLVAPDNDKMKRYVEQRATPEEPATMYLMEVK